MSEAFRTFADAAIALAAFARTSSGVFWKKSEIYIRPVVQSHHTQLFDTSQFSSQNSGL